MDKHSRSKTLNELAKTANGQALKDWIEENIDSLKDVTQVDKDNFEQDARGRAHAVELLQKLFNTINIKIETSKRSSYR